MGNEFDKERLQFEENVSKHIKTKQILKKNLTLKWIID